MSWKYEVLREVGTLPPGPNGMCASLPLEPKRAVPIELQAPVVADADLYFHLLDHNETSRQLLGTADSAAEINAMLTADLNVEIAEKWQKLFEFFGVEDTPDGWRQIAIVLANQVLPGLHVSYQKRPDDVLAQKKRTHLLVLAAHFAKEKLKLQGNLNPLDKEIVGQLWNDWPGGFMGERPTEGTLATQFSRAKAEYEGVRAELFHTSHSLRALGFEP